MPFYDPNLASIHHRGYISHVQNAAPAILEILREHHITGRVVDLGCGSGVLARALLDNHFYCTGIDVSPAMIDLARANAPGADLVCASLHDADIPPCSAVTSVGECLNYLNAAPEDPRSLETLFTRIHAALHPGGVLIFDIALPGRAGPTGHSFHNRVAEDWALLSESIETPGRLERRITAFSKDAAGTWHRIDETHLLRLTPATEILATLADIGFEARPIDPYQGATFPPGYGAFLANKPR